MTPGIHLFADDLANNKEFLYAVESANLALRGRRLRVGTYSPRHARLPAPHLILRLFKSGGEPVCCLPAFNFFPLYSF